MVNFLAAYIYKQTNAKALYRVDIKREVDNFRRKTSTGRKPVVIFDFIGTITILAHHYTEAMCGGRHNECIRRAESLFKKFHDLGVDLVFFLDGLIKDIKLPESIRRKNRRYEEEKILFAILKAQECPEPSQYRFQKYLMTYYDNYLRVARKYGRVYISVQNECDLDISEYATRTKPLAVLAYDSDFLIMPGDWPIWIPDSLNVRNMTVDVWDKRKLRESLDLEQWQMPILATLSGGDYIEFKHVEHLWKQFSGDQIQMVKALAGYIRQTFENAKDLSIKLTDLIYKNGSGEHSYAEIEELVEKCQNFYDYNYKINGLEPNWLHKHSSETGSCHVYSIYYQKVLQVPQRYIDLSKDNVRPFADLVLPLIRREVGIMYSNRRVEYRDFKQRICLKPSETEPFCIKEYIPIFPDFEVPEMEIILSNGDDISLEKRAEILSWLVSPKGRKLSADHILKLLDTIFIVPALTVNYLVEERQIAPDEADILLLTIFKAFQKDPIEAKRLQGPETVAEHTFWLSHLYTNLVNHFDEAMIFCGLFTYVPHSYFDGYIFHAIYADFLRMTFDQKVAIRKPISDYRLFVQ